MSSETVRSAATPPAAAPDPGPRRPLDILDELQKALDATRVLGAPQQAPPLAPRFDDGRSPKDGESKPPPLREKYAPPAARRVHAAAAELGAALQPEKFAADPDPGSRTPKAPQGLGSIAARASAEQANERRRLDVGPAPDFLRIARPERDRTQPGSAAAVGRPLPDGRGSLRTGHAGDEARRDEILRRILQPQQPPAEGEEDEWVKPVKRRWTASIGFAALTSLVAGSLGFLIYQFFSTSATDDNAAKKAVQVSSLSSSFAKSHSDRAAEKNAPKLVLSAVSGSSNRPVALGINIDAAPPGSFIVIRGLQPGSRVTAGTSAGEGAWRVPMRELPHAAVMPPQDFVGTMDLSVDLRRNDDSVADSDVQRISWIASGPNPAVAKPVKTTAVSPTGDVFPPPPPPRSSAAAPQTNGSRESSLGDPRSEQAQTSASRRLDPEEVRNLIQRGDAALQSGDIAAARLLLRRAAEAGDMTAAMALAATYDPGVLTQLGALGAKADVGTARGWYQKAADRGSPEAKRRLRELEEQ
jgi:hypothetical protein